MDRLNINSRKWLLAFVVVLAIPHYALIDLGGIALNPLRVFLIIGALIAVWQIRYINFVDILMASFASWLVICTLYNYGFEEGFGRAGFLLVETLFAYLIGRVFVTKITDFTDLCRYILILALILSLLSIPEAILRWRFIADAVNLFFTHDYLNQDDIRYGILRARTVFSHQILFGIFCSFAVCLLFTVIYYKKNTTRYWVAIPLVIGIAMSVSSTAIMVLMMTVGALILERYTRQVDKRGVYITLGFSIFVLFSELFVGGGVFGIVNRYLSISGTGYYRVQIWELGWINIWENPILGMVGENWKRYPWMLGSIDNYYIKVGIYFGFVGLLLLVATIIASLTTVIRFNGQVINPQLRYIIFGWWLAFLGMSVAAISVDLFGQFYALYFMWIGVGQALIVAANKLPAGFVQKRQSRSFGPSVTAG